MAKEIYTPLEVSALCGVNQDTVYRWIKQGKLKATKLGQYKIHKADLEKALGRKLD